MSEIFACLYETHETHGSISQYYQNKLVPEIQYFCRCVPHFMQTMHFTRTVFPGATIEHLLS